MDASNSKDRNMLSFKEFRRRDGRPFRTCTSRDKTTGPGIRRYTWRPGSKHRVGLVVTVFVASLCAFAVVVSATTSPEFVRKFGQSGSGTGEFNVPSGIAVDSDGNIYVADRDNDRIVKYSTAGAPLITWGTTGSANGEFDSPRDIAVDGHNNVYVVDTGNTRVQKFTHGGTYLTQWGTIGTGPGQFQAPRAIAINADSCVYVTDDGFSSNRVQKFSSTGGFLLQWGTTGTEDGQFVSPRGIAVDDSGDVYVSDTLSDRLQKFTGTGMFKSEWGVTGSGTGDFAFPIGLAWGTDCLYVVDSQNHRVQAFDHSGSYLFQFGSNCQISNGTGCTDPDGGGPLELGDGQFDFPQGIAVDATGLVIVSDTENHRIQEFSPVSVSSAPTEQGGYVSVRAFPNPTDSGLQVHVDLGADALASSHVVRANVYDIAGRLVQGLHADHVAGGSVYLSWNGFTRGGRAAPHGIYFLNVRIDGALESSIRIVRLPR